MRYSLRTLLLVMLLGGPALAGLWFLAVWISNNTATSIVFGIQIVAFLAATTLAVNLKRLIRMVSARLLGRNSKD